MPQLVTQGGWPSTMYNVGGRVRKGKPFQLGTNFGHGFRDAGHRGGGLFKALRAFRRTTDTQGTSTARRQFLVRQNCVKMVPEDSQNGSSSERNAFEATKWHQMAPGSGFCRCDPSLFELSGDPEGLRKSIKNRLFAKKCVLDVLFFDVLCADKHLTRFFRILYRFFAKNQ